MLRTAETSAVASDRLDECTVEYCWEPVRCLGLCTRHYYRDYRRRKANAPTSTYAADVAKSDGIWYQ